MFRQQHPHQQDVDFFTSLNSNRIQGDVLDAELTNAVRTKNSAVFSQKLKDESLRLAKFVDAQQIRLELAAKQIFGRAHSLSQSKIRNVSEAHASLQDLKQSTRRMVDDCVALQEFYSQNRKSLMQVATKADIEFSPSGKFVESLETSYHPLLSKAHLNSSLVCVISDTFDALRQTHHKILHGDGENALWQAPSSFQRNTTKYWVPHESLTKLMMICAAEAPLLVYGKQGPLTSTNPVSLKSSEGDKLWDGLATKITSIYFDSDRMDLYRERLKRTEGAQLLRARWYGPTMPQGDKPIFVELKTHHERWVNQKSVKERATIQEQDMPKFLEPVRWSLDDAKAMILRAVKKNKEMKLDELDKQTRLLFRMHNLVVNHKLTACVRSVYDRAAFQSAKSNGE
jgi:SPX domain protein involved in polyphosphate accumulation